MSSGKIHGIVLSQLLLDFASVIFQEKIGIIRDKSNTRSKKTDTSENKRRLNSPIWVWFHLSIPSPNISRFWMFSSSFFLPENKKGEKMIIRIIKLKILQHRFNNEA